MSKRKKKIHLFRSERSTWCGRDIKSGTGWNQSGWKPVPAERCTRVTADVTCETCLLADAAETRKQA